jgi:hypothetical protein
MPDWRKENTHSKFDKDLTTWTRISTLPKTGILRKEPEIMPLSDKAGSPAQAVLTTQVLLNFTETNNLKNCY